MHIFNTLKQKLIFYLLLCSILPIGAITFFITYMGNRVAKEQVSNELYQLAILLEGNVSRFLDNGKRISTFLASEQYIKKELELFNKEGRHLKSAQKKLCKYLNSRCSLYDSILSITILNKDGIIIASSNDIFLGEDKSDNSLYNMAKDTPVVSDVYFSEEYQCGAIDFVVPVSSEKDGAILGLLVMKVDKSELDAVTTGESNIKGSPVTAGNGLKPLRTKKRQVWRRGGSDDMHSANKSDAALQKVIRKGTTREAYIVNKDKLMVTASRFMEKTFLKQPVNTAAVIHSLNNRGAFSGIYKDYRGEWVMGFSRFIKDTDWVLLVETDLHEAFHPIKRVRFIAFVAFAGSIGSILILVSIATLRIVKNISSVEKAIQNVSRGNLNAHLENHKGDEIGRLAASFNDMTIALKQSKDALRNLFDAANDPMFIIKEGEKIADMNKRVTEIFGYEKEELIGNSIAGILNTQSIPVVKQTIARTWNLSPGQKYPTFDVSVITGNNKELICELDLNRTAYGIQPHFRDVTETRRLEGILEGKNQELEEALKNLKETQAKLIQAGKLAGIGELASGVAHEVNNPLTAVMGHALRLLRKTESEELKDIKALDPFRTELKIIADASLRCKRITDGLLRFSRVSAELKSSNLSVNAVVDDTLLLVENTLEQKKIKLIKQFDPHLKYIMGDHNQLQQVFTNIINNAIHAMPNGGSLLIATGGKENPGKSSSPEVRLGEITNNKYIAVEFTDTGCGIKEEHISKIFDPFFTTKEPGKGTGLGLSISYSIIKDHNGWIDVKSAVGKGTTFLVMLPVVENINKVQNKKIIS